MPENLKDLQNLWEQKLKHIGLNVGRGDTVPTAHVGSSREIDAFANLHFWDKGLNPSQQERSNSTAWDTLWKHDWNFLYADDDGPPVSWQWMYLPQHLKTDCAPYDYTGGALNPGWGKDENGISTPMRALEYWKNRKN